MVRTLPLNQALKELNLPNLNRNLFSSPQWLKVIQRTYGTRIFVKYLERQGEVDSYIIYSVVANFLEWKICFLSYCDYFDSHVKSSEDWLLFYESLRQDYPRYRIAIRNLRDDIIKQSPKFQVLSKERYHVLDIQADLDTVWRHTHDSFRSAVKQAQKFDLVVKRCDKSYLRKFFQLHLDLRKNKYRLFPQPYRFFDIIWQEYMDQDQGVLLGAFDNKNNLIAANVYLVCGDTLYYKFNTSSLQATNLRPNNLLFWEGIKFGKEKGLKFIDLGSSGYDQHGLILFKNHTGAKIMDITHLGYAPPDYKFSQKRILRTMTQFFTQDWVPDWMVRLGSNIIYPFLA